MGFFSSKGTDGAKSDGKPANTISDRGWFRVQKAAAGEVDLIEGPWTDPRRAAKKAAWGSAEKNRRNN